MKIKHIKSFTRIVKALADCSEDKRVKVGCIILNDNRIISTGYNGQLPGLPHEPIIIDDHDISTVHAEMNALMNCSRNGMKTKDCVMFTTHFPCQICTKLAVTAGIKTVYYLKDYKNRENPFSDVIQIIKVK